VAYAVGWRQLHNTYTTPSLLLPGLLFPLLTFVAYAGGLARLTTVPGFEYPGGYTGFQFVFAVLQSAAFGGVFTGFAIARDWERGIARRLLLAAPNRAGIVGGYAIGALGRWVGTAVFLTVVALAVGMHVDWNVPNLGGLVLLGVALNAFGVLWAAGSRCACARCRRGRSCRRRCSCSSGSPRCTCRSRWCRGGSTRPRA
jgi:ABC-2 type transport system permease protein